MTDAQTLFDSLNTLRFGGHLEPYRVLRGCVESRAEGECHRLPREIRLDESLEGTDLRAVMLHEMAHASVGGYSSHGTDFVNELRRLVQAGEFCLQADLTRYGNAL